MRRRLAMALLAVALLAGAGAAVLWGAAQGGVGAVPITSAPQAAPSGGTDPFVDTPPGRLPGPPPIPTPTVPPTPTPTVPPKPALQDIDGAPVHITVQGQGGILIDADIGLIQLNGDGWLDPEVGLAGWYGPPQWDTVPGNLSDYRAVIVGHNVTGYGTKDVFYDLGQVRAGDGVTITYALRAGGLATAQFTVVRDASVVPKQDVVAQAATTYKWVWQSDAPERALSLFSCDLDAPHVDGHSVANWVVSAVRVS